MSEQYKQLPIKELQEFIGDEPQSVEDLHLDLETKLSRKGILFDHIPESIYPGMPYIPVAKLVKENNTQYTRHHISKLAREGEIPAYRVGEGWILDPQGVEILLKREEESSNRTYFFSGRKPGSNGNKRNF